VEQAPLRLPSPPISVLACVSVARRQKFEGLRQEEPVSELLESLADVPDDVLRVIVGFMGEGFGTAPFYI